MEKWRRSGFLNKNKGKGVEDGGEARNRRRSCGAELEEVFSLKSK